MKVRIDLSKLPFKETEKVKLTIDSEEIEVSVFKLEY
jgi:hypothetical protein